MIRFILLLLIAAGIAAAALYAGAERAKLQVAEGMGPNPALPEPNTSFIPTINVAKADPWGAGEAPTPADGLKANLFAGGLDHPRWLYVLPNGDVLVAETNAPARPAAGKGVRAKIQGFFMKRAGARTLSANRVTLLRDADHDGAAETKTTLLQGRNSPFGMALVGSSLYVADTDAIVRFPYADGATEIAQPAERVTDLPAGPRNHHWTKNIVASADGTKLYAAVGSNSNVAEHGMEEEEGRAAIWEVDLATGAKRLFATGLRNPVGMAFEPTSQVLWTTVNERDELGSDLVPDYMTSVTDGGFYGWPYSYYGNHVDTRVEPQNPDLVGRAIVPDYALGPHTASLGLAITSGAGPTPGLSRGAFVGQHGSWNRNPPSGYKVIFIPFTDGRPSGEAIDVLTGFLSEDGRARGRPVGVALTQDGSLLVADDVGNRVWRVSAR